MTTVAENWGDEPTISLESYASLGLPPRYQVRGVIGRGGMGSVFRVYDRTAGHEVALKMLHGFRAEDRMRLKSEFRTLGNIVHPNLVDLYDLVVDERVSFFTMALVRGEDFATDVRALKQRFSDPETCRIQFLERARQLASAVDAIHQGGKVHGDIKPSNVLVTSSGRVVLLDFGLSFSLSSLAHDLDEVAGTPAYLAPECFWGATPSAASDWYSFGVTLYESLCEPPIPVESLRLRLMTGQKTVGPTALVSTDLDEFLSLLLQDDPTKRPAIGRILEALGGVDGRESRRPSVPVPFQQSEVLGRTEEQRTLHRLFEAVTRGQLQVVEIQGTSGIGKTALVRSFFSDLSKRTGAMLLQSSCHPQEALAFNALDGLIDELSKEVGTCLSEEERRLPDEQHTALSQLFPVLSKALDVDLAPSGRKPNDRERRNLAVQGLRELLRRLALRWTVVLWLDDVQWADRDSGLLLRDLLGGEEPPPVLLVMSYREEDAAESSCLRVLRESHKWMIRSTKLRLGPLDNTSSVTLVRSIIGASPDTNPELVSRAVERAAGSPFLLGELARYFLSDETHHQATQLLGMGEIVRARTQNLSSDSRRILEVLAVAGSPLEPQTTLAAANLKNTNRGLLTNLERLSILRTTDLNSHRVEFYHHKLQEEVLRQLSPEAKQQLHQAIGQALLATTPNPLAALEHFEAATDLDAVRRYIVAAADHALKSLAFERAAGLFKRAIELQPGDVPHYELYRRLGLSLGSAGRGQEAGAAFLNSAALARTESAKGDLSIGSEVVVALQQKAAEQFVISGHFRDGVEATFAVFDEYKVPYPRSRKEAVFKAGLLRLRALLRRPRMAQRKTPATEYDLQRFDVLWLAGTRLSMVEHALCSYASARCFLDALELGDAGRASCAMSLEAAYLSTLPAPAFQRRSQLLLAQAAHLVPRHGNRLDAAVGISAARAITSFYGGKFRQAHTYAQQAMDELHASEPGSHWTDAPWQMWSLLGLALSGQMRTLINSVLVAAEDAARRDDLHVEKNISLGAPALAWLALDRPKDALFRAERALSWAPSDYSAQHYEHYITTVDIALYMGDGLAAWKRTVATWPAHKAESFLLLVFIRDDLWRTRGRSALAAVVALQQSGTERTESGHDVAKLLAEARTASRVMSRHKLPCSIGWARLLDAGIYSLRGDQTRAIDALSSAIELFELAQTQLFYFAARFCRGVLQGSPGDSERLEAYAWMRAQGILKPEHLVQTCAPGIIPA